MKIQIIQIFFIVFAYTIPYTPQPEQIKSNQTQNLLQKLINLDQQIDQLINKNQYTHFQFNRLFQTNFRQQNQSFNITNVDIIPTINLPYKDNFYYTIMIKRNLNYYTLKGDLLYSGIGKHTLVATARNQYTYFLEILTNRTILFHKLRVSNKKAFVQYEQSLNLNNYPNFQINSALFVHQSNQKTYVFVDKRGRIAYFDKESVLIKEITVKDKILQVEKISQNIIVLTQKQLFFLNLNKNSSKIDCLLPEGSIDYIKYEDSNFRYFYGIKQGYMYQYQLAKHCRPIKSYYIPQNSSIFFASTFAFIQSKSVHYALNTTSSDLKPYILPISQCQGNSKLNLIRKTPQNYIIARLCQNNSYLNISFIMVQLQIQEISVADYSKFRIPLLLFSFGVIIYVTVKNKKKQLNQAQGQEQLKKKLLLKMNQLKSPIPQQEQPDISCDGNTHSNTIYKQPKRQYQSLQKNKNKPK